MRCGKCKQPFKTFEELAKHWKETGCNWGRPVWERHAMAKKRGTSGKRILAEGLPGLYRSKPMSEEAKARLRELGDRRQGMKVAQRRRPPKRSAGPEA